MGMQMLQAWKSVLKVLARVELQCAVMMHDVVRMAIEVEGGTEECKHGGGRECGRELIVNESFQGLLIS